MILRAEKDGKEIRSTAYHLELRVRSELSIDEHVQTVQIGSPATKLDRLWCVCGVVRGESNQQSQLAKGRGPRPTTPPSCTGTTREAMGGDGGDSEPPAVAIG